jgi:hypothetical protein
MTLPLVWRRYQQELRVQRGVSPNTAKSYQDGWTSYLMVLKQMAAPQRARQTGCRRPVQEPAASEGAARASAVR